MDSTELVEATGGLLRLVNAPGRTKGKVEHIVVPAFKQIEPGMMMLGIVKRVTRRQLFVALPYGLSGLVSVREVADVLLFNDRIQDDDEIDDDDNDEKSDDDAESDDEDDEDEDDEDEDDEKETANGHARKKRRQSGGNSGAAAAAAVEASKRNASSLEAFFAVGQTVRCAVLSTSASKHGKKSVNLSLRPSVINKGLFMEHLVGASSSSMEHSTTSSSSAGAAARRKRLGKRALESSSSAIGSSVYGAVASVQDHGYIVSFGGQEIGFSGFLNKKDVDRHPADVNQDDDEDDDERRRCRCR